MKTTEVTPYAGLTNSTVQAANGISYASRDTGGHGGTVPLVLLQHFRGNLDYWDHALIDALAQSHRAITFDNAGVGNSAGTTPDTIDQMPRDAIAFISALELGQADLLGFSIGSFVAQEIALRRPALVRRLILASSAPKGAPRIYGPAPGAVGSGGTAQSSAEGYLRAFFAPSAASQQAGKQALGRMFARTEDRDEMTNLATVEAQFEAARVWSMPDHYSALERLQALEMPVFAANGDSDQMICLTTRTCWRA